MTTFPSALPSISSVRPATPTQIQTYQTIQGSIAQPPALSFPSVALPNVRQFTPASPASTNMPTSTVASQTTGLKSSFGDSNSVVTSAPPPPKARGSGATSGTPTITSTAASTGLSSVPSLHPGATRVTTSPSTTSIGSSSIPSTVSGITFASKPQSFQPTTSTFILPSQPVQTISTSQFPAAPQFGVSAPTSSVARPSGTTLPQVGTVERRTGVVGAAMGPMSSVTPPQTPKVPTFPTSFPLSGTTSNAPVNTTSIPQGQGLYSVPQPTQVSTVTSQHLGQPTRFQTQARPPASTYSTLMKTPSAIAHDILGVKNPGYNASTEFTPISLTSARTTMPGERIRTTTPPLPLQTQSPSALLQQRNERFLQNPQGYIQGSLPQVREGISIDRLNANLATHGSGTKFTPYGKDDLARIIMSNFQDTPARKEALNSGAGDVMARFILSSIQAQESPASVDQQQQNYTIQQINEFIRLHAAKMGYSDAQISGFISSKDDVRKIEWFKNKLLPFMKQNNLA